MKSGPENSKEFVEMNFQLKFTDDDEKPVQALVDIPMANSSTAAESSKEDDSRLPKIDIYDEQSAIYIGPMFIVHRNLQRSLSVKISLDLFLRQAVDPCKA